MNTKLMIFDPFKEMHTVNDANLLFDLGDFLPTKSTSDLFAPVIDVSETDNDYQIVAEIPGIKKEELTVDLTDNVLTIKGEKKIEKEVKTRNYHRSERSFGTFIRRIQLPVETQSEKIKADYKEGVLTVTVPKTEKAKPKKVEIEVK